MEEVIRIAFKLIQERMDIILIVAIVAIIQMLKKFFPKLPKKAWLIVLIGAGLLAAFLTIPTIVNHGKQFATQAFVYIAGCELLYQSWRTLVDMIKLHIKPKGKEGK